MQISAAMPCGGVCLNIFRHLVFEFINGMTNLDSENGILRVGVHILLLRVFFAATAACDEGCWSRPTAQVHDAHCDRAHARIPV